MFPWVVGVAGFGGLVVVGGGWGGGRLDVVVAAGCGRMRGVAMGGVVVCGRYDGACPAEGGPDCGVVMTGCVSAIQQW